MQFACGVKGEKQEDFGIVSVSDMRPASVGVLIRSQCYESTKEKLKCLTHNKVENCTKNTVLETPPRILAIVYYGNGYLIDIEGDGYVNIGEV